MYINACSYNYVYMELQVWYEFLDLTMGDFSITM